VLIAELPAYGISLWFLTRWLGVEGTALAWTGRIIVEAVILFFISQRILPQRSRYVIRLSVVVVGGLAVLCVGCASNDIGAKIGFVFLILVAFWMTVWFWALTPGERQFVVGARAEASVRNSS
jgi:hypothetical protein